MKEIKISRGLTTIVDDDDFEYLNQWKWYAKYTKISFYVCRDHYDNNRNRKHIMMHRLITKVPDHLFVDHINHDTLDNRKCNLRICTMSENYMNTKPRNGHFSKYKGVWRATNIRHRRKIWTSTIRIGNKRKCLGYFNTEEEAAFAYDKAAKENFGEFAYLNFK